MQSLQVSQCMVLWDIPHLASLRAMQLPCIFNSAADLCQTPPPGGVVIKSKGGLFGAGTAGQGWTCLRKIPQSIAPYGSH